MNEPTYCRCSADGRKRRPGLRDLLIAAVGAAARKAAMLAQLVAEMAEHQRAIGGHAAHPIGGPRRWPSDPAKPWRWL